MDDRPHPPKSETMESTWTTESNDSNAITGVGPPALWAMINAATRYEREDLDDDSSEDIDSAESPSQEEKPLDLNLSPVTTLDANNSPLARLAQLSVTNYNNSPRPMLDEVVEILEPPPISNTPDPDVILQLIQQEFGTIARDGEEEVFITQRDVGIIIDAMILGVMHVTSHRVTFHASLLSMRPDLAPNAQIIKSGPIVIHRRGLHRKRRRWIELSHDMISLYKNATDEARARPLRSLLLSDITKVYEMDPARPTVINLSVTKGRWSEVDRLEFDTTESAVLWRREIQEAIFLNRQRKHDLLCGNIESPDAPNGRRENTGVRICIPLHRIEAVNGEQFLDFAQLVSLSINRDDTAHPYDQGLKYYPQKAFKLVCLTMDSGTRLRVLVTSAKARRALRPEVPFPPTADIVTVDFGPLAFADHCEPNVFSTPRSPETSVSTRQRRAEATERRMKKMFALREDLDVFVNRTWLQDCIHSSGYLVISNEYICFWAKSYTSSDITYRFATRDVNQAKPEASRFWGHHSFSVEIKGHHTLHFATQGVYVRDSVVRRINSARDQSLSTGFIPTLPSIGSPEPNNTRESTSPSSLSGSDGAASSTLVERGISPTLSGTENSSAALATAYLAPLGHTINFIRGLELSMEALSILPRPVNIPHSVLTGKRSRHFICLSIGSRGDVQPYIALCLGLIAAGHTATIVTHEEYKEWVEGFGVTHRTAGGDPTALMRLSVEHSMFSPQFFKESLGKFRGWLDQLLLQAWQQCQDADVLIESPSAMAGVHIAEALKIPYIRAFTMPWTRTTAYPHAFLSPPMELSGTLNYSTYVLFDNIFWTAMSGQVNRWRKKHLHIPRTDIDTLAQTKIPFIYNFSPAVVPKPLDWGDIIEVSGYWFLDNPDLNWKAPRDLLDFIAKAKSDRVPLVYIGFGSIVVPHPRAMTRSIVKGVLKAGVRAIISRGWSDRLESEKEKEQEEVVIPPECYTLDKVPHDWLFPQLDVAVHHGGAGTTGASLRAGIPTLIKPWFGDQFFWASRVHKLGAGLRVDSLSSSELSAALKKATSDRVMKEKAAAVGERIRAEDNVNNATRVIYTYMDRAANRSAAQ